MTLARKVCWICCPTKEGPDSERTAAVYLSVDPQYTSVTAYELRVFNTRIFDAALLVRFCPTCGKPVPTPEALITLEALVDKD